MKLTPEQKKYRKTVIFNNEIKMLQDKIDNLNLSKPLTIKQLTFDYNKSQNHRMLCLIFKETFKSFDFRRNKSKNINKWAGVDMVFDGSGTKLGGGLTISNRFCSSGCVYYDDNVKIDDEDIRKVCDMLANEYFIWIHWTDHHIYDDLKFLERKSLPQNSGIDKYNFIKYGINVMWKRLDIAFEGRYTKYSITELLKKYNEQIKRGLIIDCPFDNDKLPFDEVEEIEVADKFIKEGSLYG